MSSTAQRRIPSSAFFRALAVVALSGAGCGGSNAQPPTSTAAAVTGPVDMHCIDNGLEIKQAIGMCLVDDGGTTPTLPADGGSVDGGGDGGGAGTPTSDYGPTLPNAEGDDDDCKYHVKWTSTAVMQNAGVTFYVKVTRRADGMPAIGANIELDVYLNSTHPTPSLDIRSAESAGGNYKVGPVLFDAPGMWTVRFHLY